MQSWKRFEYRVRDFFLKRGFRSFRVPISGTSQAMKGDVTAEKGKLKFLVDAKSTAAKEEIRIERESLEKIKVEAKRSEISVLVFSFKLHHKLYGVVDGQLLSNSGIELVEKATWAEDSIGIKREDVDKALKEGKGIWFSFNNSDRKLACAPSSLRKGRKSYAAVELGELVDFLERTNRALPKNY